MSIDSKELRIGNRITAIRDDAAVAYATITNIDGFNRKVRVAECKLLFDLDNNQCKPICLSLELLKMCGFAPDGKHHWSLQGFEPINEITGIYVYWKDSEMLFQQSMVSEYYAGVDIPIQYLHQLQNLYYSLTGKELEIKL